MVLYLSRLLAVSKGSKSEYCAISMSCIYLYTHLSNKKCLCQLSFSCFSFNTLTTEETLLLRKKSSNVPLVFFVLFCGGIQMCTSKNLLFPCDN
jgi:hypothetical protein